MDLFDAKWSEWRLVDQYSTMVTKTQGNKRCWLNGHDQLNYGENMRWTNSSFPYSKIDWKGTIVDIMVATYNVQPQHKQERSVLELSTL